MPAKQPSPGLMERLPAVRGILQADAPMAKLSWFKAGGMADVLFQPADVDDLAGVECPGAEGGRGVSHPRTRSRANSATPPSPGRRGVAELASTHRQGDLFL